MGLGSRVWGLGIGVWGLGFGVWGLGFGVWGLGFGSTVLELGACDEGFRVQSIGVRDYGVPYRGPSLIRNTLLPRIT